MDFLMAIGPKNPISGSPSVASPVTCTTNSSLISVIENLSLRQVHRIYVVEAESMNVLGVVTLRDVISCFIHEPADHFDNYLGFAIEEMLNK